MLYLPSKSVVTPLAVSLTSTFAKGKGSLKSPSITFPIIPY